MVIVEIALLVVGIVAIISATDFIAKTTSNITHSFGISEYLASTIVLSFMIMFPFFIIMQISNFYDIPVLGLSAIMGFSITLLTLVMGVFLFKNELPIEYEGHRNSTFMWAAALLLLIVSFDKFIDRMDAIFLLLLFVFYIVYIVFRSEKSKEYVYLKKIKFNWWLYPVSLITILISCWFLVFSLSSLNTIFNMSYIIVGGVFLSFLLCLPIFDIIFSMFRSSSLTFDNLLGNVVVTLTLAPGLAALTLPIPLALGGEMTLAPFILLNVIALSFAMVTRLTYKIHRKMAVFLFLLYVFYVVHMFIL